MSWSILQDVPNPHIDSNGDPYSGAVLKAYLPGTTTSTSIAIDSSGGSPQTSITYNAEGKLEVSGNEILPYIDKKVKWGIFANSSDAASNTPFQTGPYDNVEKTLDGSSTTGIYYDTMAAATADASLSVDDILIIKDRADGTFDVISGTGTANTYNIVAHDTLSISLSLRTQGVTNVKQFGATAGGIVNDRPAIQTAVDSLTSGGIVFFPKGTYEITSAITHTAGYAVILQGEGASSIVQNSTSGNTIEMGDGITQIADCGVKDLKITNSVASGAGLYVRKRTNILIDNNVINCTGTGGYGIRMEASWSVKITQNNIEGVKGYGIYLGVTCNIVWIAGNRMDGATSNAGVGIRATGGIDTLDIIGNNIESWEGCGILAETVRGLNIVGNFFENNGETGLTFTSGDSRTIKSDIIISGGVYPQLGAGFPCEGIRLEGNTFVPQTLLAVDSTVYLVGSNGFYENSNSVNAAYYDTSAMSFIKSKNNGAVYLNDNITLGNSELSGNVYLDIENTNQSGTTNYDKDGISSLIMNPRFAPTFNAQEITGTAPTSYTELTSGTPKLTTTLATGRYKGRLIYDVTTDATSTSGYWGVAIAEADFEDFYDGELWVAYFDVKAKTGTPGFEMYINDGTGYFASGGGSATTSSWAKRAIVFKPVTGFDFTFVYRMFSAASASDAVTITKPVICPLGQVQAAIPFGM